MGVRRASGLSLVQDGANEPGLTHVNHIFPTDDFGNCLPSSMSYLLIFLFLIQLCPLLPCSPGILNLSTVDILGHISLHGEGLACRISISIPGPFHYMSVGPPSMTTKNVYRHCRLGARSLRIPTLVFSLCSGLPCTKHSPCGGH
jgi:hypothetical protein